MASKLKGSSLKDMLFNENKVRYLAGLFLAADPKFNADGFVDDVMAELLPLELKARSRLIGMVLGTYLPDDFTAAATVISKALPPPLDPDLKDNDFGNFIFDPLGEYIAANGLNNLSVALPLIKDVTQRFSMEFSLRFFLISAPAETMAALTHWAIDDNYHVRRLVSEGTRPNLPWGKKVPLNVREPVPLLDVLHADRTRFVTRSVANHLNDISKTEPTLVIETLERWKTLGAQDVRELEWMTRHSLRTLVKKGDLAALAVLGYSGSPKIEISDVCVSANKIAIGDSLEFSFEIAARADENLMIDYAIDFVKANGSTSPKVFKLKKMSVTNGQRVTLRKTHTFLKDASTFTHYKGTHRLYLQINGRRFDVAEFELL